MEARNNTECYFWVAGSHRVRRLEYYSKLPYEVSYGIDIEDRFVDSTVRTAANRISRPKYFKLITWILRG